MPRPNILLVCADHLRHDALSPNGNGFVHTSNIARLAASGVNFRNSFTPNPICVPARASMTTGNYSHFATGQTTNSGFIHDRQPIMAHHFNRAGYATYACGKLHYAPYAKYGEPRLVHGFQSVDLAESGRIVSGYTPDPPRGLEDYFDYLRDVGWSGYTRAHAIGNNDVHPAPSPLPAEHYVDSWVATRAIARLDEHRRARGRDPWLMWMSFPKPHSPYDPPEPWHRLYDPRRIPRPVGNPDLLADRAPHLTIGRARYNWPRMSPEAIQVARAYYFGCVSHQDHCFGRVLDWLDATGQRENTIVAYMSDHGDLLGDFGCFFKGNFLNGSVRVPFIWSAPSLIPVGETRDALVGLQDLLPTVAGLAEAPLDQSVHGADLSAVLRGESPTATEGERPREVYVGETANGTGGQLMACDGRWKYIHSEDNGVEELYDQRNDYAELGNFAARRPEEVRRLRAYLVDWCRRFGHASALTADGSDLAEKPLDVAAHAKFSEGSFGWRWY